MFTGDHRSNRDELERFAVAAVGAFLAGYGSTNQPAARSKRTLGKKTSVKRPK
jgi:hypothetical protein